MRVLLRHISSLPVIAVVWYRKQIKSITIDRHVCSFLCLRDSSLFTMVDTVWSGHCSVDSQDSLTAAQSNVSSCDCSFRMITNQTCGLANLFCVLCLHEKRKHWLSIYYYFLVGMVLSSMLLIHKRYEKNSP